MDDDDYSTLKHVKYQDMASRQRDQVVKFSFLRGGCS